MFILSIRGKILLPVYAKYFYNVIHQFGQEKFVFGGLILSTSQFLLLPQLPLNFTLDTKLVKMTQK